MKNTSHFFLDGSLKKENFFNREKPDPLDWGKILEELNQKAKLPEKTEILINRGILFFHEDQKISYEKIKQYFTDKAIHLLEKDGFIKINK